jgi:uncharacterized membrane protein YczE
VSIFDGPAASVDPALAFARSTPASFVSRLARCVAGLLICGLGIALIISADIGLAPWDVLHKGISRHTDLAVGSVLIVVGFALLVVWVPLRVRPGLGTILNAVLVGGTVNVVLDHLPEPDNPVLQLSEMAAGVAAFALGTALYIGAGLGPGPRDGLMTGIAARGHSLRLVRTAIEVTVLGTGWLLGGTIGIGTAVFAFGIGPLVQFFLGVFGTRTPPALVAAD